MAKYKVVLTFEIDAETADEALDIFYEWDDREFLEYSVTTATTAVEEPEHA